MAPRGALTVGELKALLADFDDDVPVAVLPRVARKGNELLPHAAYWRSEKGRIYRERPTRPGVFMRDSGKGTALVTLA